MPQAPTARPPERYGDDRPLWHRTLARVLAAALAAAGVGFLVWVAVDDDRGGVSWTDVGFRLDDAPDRVEVDFQVSMDPGTEATCTLRALNAQFRVVGEADVEVGSSSARSRRLTGVVRISEPAVSAGVRECVPR